MPKATIRFIPPAPPEFRDEFAKGGWRRVERIYGARTDLLLKWIAMTGAQAARDEHLRNQAAVIARGSKG